MTCGQAIRDLRQAARSEGHPLGTSWKADEAERELAAAIDAAQQDAYANGRADEHEAFAALLPGSHYMDPPDGGDVSILEQFRRMAEDAARWRWFMAGLGDQGQKLTISVDMAIQEDKKAAA